MSLHPRKWLGLLVLLMVAACEQPPTQMTEVEKHEVSKLTENMKTHCIGRYLVDMPSDVLILGDAKVQGVTIESRAISHDGYLREIESRTAELKATKPVDVYPYLYADEVIDGPDAHYFIHRGDVHADPGNRVFEAYKWDHGRLFLLGTRGSDFLHPDQTKDFAVRQMSIKNDVLEKTRLIVDLVRRLHWRAEDDIPSVPGLCFPEAFLAGTADVAEVAGAQFVLAGNRDVSIRIESNSGIRETTTLLQRSAQIDGVLASMKGVRTLRKGKVALPGIDAEEWLIAGETDWEVPGSMFTLEANSTTSGAQSPLLMVDFNTGSPNAFMQQRVKTASLSEREAVALWDAISRTLRPRSNGF